MDDEIALISDGDGLAVIGDEGAVERFLESEGLTPQAVGMPRLGSVLNAGAAAAQAGSLVAANSGRWVKLTKESAQLVKKHGLMDSGTPGVSHAMVGQRGSIKSWIQVVKGPGAGLTSPAMLAGAAGIMAQLAMQQTMKEITDYLAAIDEKVDDVLRAQKDEVLARMIGVGMVVDEAMTIREHGGRVNEVTWSKVQAAPATIAETQAYALRRLDAVADKLQRRKSGDLADAARDAESAAKEWLAVLARCFQLQDAVAVIELDRVLEAAPDDLNGHRLGLKAARQKRLDDITRCAERLVDRMDAAVSRANARVLLNPADSPDVVESRNQVVLVVADFHDRLGVELGREPAEARRWADAAAEARSKVVQAGASGAGAAARAGKATYGRARSAAGQLSRRIAERREDEDEPDPED